MTRFSIDIVSDTVCPWCYVGYRKLNRAITEFSASNPGHIFDITWKPYYLNPNSPKVGIDKTEFYYSKFGAERVVPMFQRLSAIGEAEGIHFKFGGKTGNTRDSHRLIQMAKGKGLQTRMVEELFAAYFENEKDITSFETLLDAAKKAGLEEDEVKGWLGSDAGGDVVDKEVHVAQRHGISGVPNFTINGRYEIGGAQDPREFIAVFKGLADASTPVTTGMTC